MIRLEMKARGSFPKELLTLFPQEKNAKVRRRRKDKTLVFTCKGNTKNIDIQTLMGIETLLQIGFRAKADWKADSLADQYITYKTTKQLLGIN